MEDEKKSSRKASAKKPSARKTPAKHTTAKPEGAATTAGATTASTAPRPSAPSDKRRTWLVIGGTIAALIALFLLIFGVLIYKYKSDSRVVQVVASVVPYPAEKINGRWVSYSNYLFEVNSIKHYYQSQQTEDGKPAVDFNTDEGKQRLTELRKQVMEQLQQEAIIRDAAAKNKVTVSSKEVDEQVKQITDSAGGEDKVDEVLQKFYGWDRGDLKNKIRFQLLRTKTAEKLQGDESMNAQAKSKAEDVLKQVKGGSDFAELAKANSQDSSAANGGDLGFFGKGQMVPEFEDVAFKQEVGQTSDLVKTKYGYHIIKTTAKKDDQVQASHILIKGLDFEQYVQDELKKAKITQYVKV